MSLLFRHVHSLLFDRRSFWTLASLVVLGDVFLTLLIIRFISYTEIDWETYMIQASLVPAGHVHIHQWLYSIGDNIRNVQYVYALLYISTLVSSIGIYARAGAPNWLILALPLSKRLHSIYVLRLFNDCWAVLFMNLSILAIQMEFDIIGAALFSVALSVKMNILLYAPALVVIFAKRTWYPPFVAREYLNGAFDLSRVFLYKWTVNWRMVSEETFLSAQWKWSLLVGHLSVLVVFGWKWFGGWNVIERALRRPSLPAGFGGQEDVVLVLFTSNLIGITFARSLHYQFYSWYAQQVPYLAWRTRFHWSIKLCLIAATEYAWNVFPSTPLSSSTLFVANAGLLLGLYIAS
ncbi:ALG3-domain-containing protein [Hymenopellis radicata]|nr:ALG3-domain-containing protein [Hymenopellis radicata]